jgi:hypothetical protein
VTYDGVGLDTIIYLAIAGGCVLLGARYSLFSKGRGTLARLAWGVVAIFGALALYPVISFFIACQTTTGPPPIACP